MVYKECGTKGPKVVDILNTFSDPKKVLIVFWHGIGDVLMFYPIFRYLRESYPQHTFTLGLLPGVGHKDIIPEGIELPEIDFLKEHDAAFVISFPMVEGGQHSLTKARYCLKKEVGYLNTMPDTSLPKLPPKNNLLVGVHFQGTCLPGSTNPDEAISKRIWDDLIGAGYVPIDLHFKHVFHNPVNKRFDWQTRTCRELQPSLATLQSMIDTCFAVIGVASGPFVISLCRKPNNTIYLQKNHTVTCYVPDHKYVLDLHNYSKDKMLDMLSEMRINNA